MRAPKQDWHQDWLIEIFCNADYPRDWRPGDAPRYRAWGEASLKGPQIDGREWTSSVPIVIAAAYFTDFLVAYKVIKDALITAIADRKICMLT